MPVNKLKLRIAPLSRKSMRWIYELLDGKGMPLMRSRTFDLEGTARFSAHRLYKRAPRSFDSYPTPADIPLKREPAKRRK